jgi:hypothetical protein
MPADVSSANESGGAESGASSSAATATATANGGGVSASGGSGAIGGSQATGGASIKTYSSTANGGRSTSSSSTATAGGTKASSQSGTGGATKVSNRCSAAYEPCAYEPSCESFSQTEEGGCLYSSFVCGKYTGWSFANGPDFVGENGTPSSAQAFIEYSNYLTKNCSSGTGGSSGVGGATSTGGSSATGGTSSTKTVAPADCSLVNGDKRCVYSNDSSDLSKCVGHAASTVTTCKNAVEFYCHDSTEVNLRCLYACIDCGGPDGYACNDALHKIPGGDLACVEGWGVY